MPRFELRTFDDLGAPRLYEVVRRREEVFVVEQECAYLDADGHDPQAWHVLGLAADDTLIAYARILPVGTVHPEHPTLGRVLTVASRRGEGLARELMGFALDRATELFGPVALKISAQTYLAAFYASLGFETIGEGYLEDGIPHVAMIRRLEDRPTD